MTKLTSLDDCAALDLGRLWYVLTDMADAGWTCEAAHSGIVGLSHGGELVQIEASCPGGKHTRFRWLGALVEACPDHVLAVTVHCGCGATDDRFYFHAFKRLY